MEKRCFCHYTAGQLWHPAPMPVNVEIIPTLHGPIYRIPYQYCPVHGVPDPWRKISCIAGTWGWRDPIHRITGYLPDWHELDSPLMKEFELHMVRQLDPLDPFTWTTGLGGLFWSEQQRVVWKASGYQAVQYQRRKQEQYPWLTIQDWNWLIHSHAWNLFVYALWYGLRANNVFVVASPLRKDVLEDVGAIDEVELLGLKSSQESSIFDNVNYIHYITDPKRDYTRDLGNWFDSHIGRVRGLKHSKVGVQLVEGISHSKLLNDAKWRKEWHPQGWIDKLVQDHTKPLPNAN